MVRRSLPVLHPGALAAPLDPPPPETPSGVVAGGRLATSARVSGAPVPGPSLRIALVTLGCDKNTVDSERILSDLVGAGAELAASPEDADLVVVNTCGFIEMAKQESIDTLLDAARLKENGRVRAVVGMGCLVQRYKRDLERELPEVDLFLGLTEAGRLVPELTRRGLVAGGGPVMERPLRVLAAGSGPGHTAHLKISEGCDHSCAFCAIPLMRGKFRSTPPDVLVREARELERRGVVELNVVSQDTTWYGRDWARVLARGTAVGTPAAHATGYYVGRPFEAMPNLGPVREVRAAEAGPEPDAASALSAWPGSWAGRIGRTGALPLLLETVLSETSIPWVRLFYMYPSGITPQLVDLMAREERIVPYLDMPLQHGSDRVLARMRRPERRDTILERVGWLRSAVPDLALRTTLIVGFPGETEEDFEMLLDLLDEIRFDHVGAFSYSEEEGTPAATMDGVVPEAVRRERLERLLDHQRAISMERNESRVGLRTCVLVDEVGDEGAAVARTPWQAAEVDGVVHVEDAAGVAPGQFVAVEITGADDYDLAGRIVT
jgi:ribosomal protein S12 methylthiotransferase